MRFRLLGSLEYFDGSRWGGLSAAKPRTLLAVLLLRPNRLVAADELIDQLWPDRAPRTAANLVHQYVGRLRRELRDTRNEMLVTRPPGYQLVLDDDHLDSTRFARLAANGHTALVAGRMPQAVKPLREALSLWRDDRAMVDVLQTPLVIAEAHRLGEQRLAVLESRVAAELACGQHGNLVSELQELLRVHPYRERLWALLLIALDRSGRRAEALTSYQRLYRLLRADLGVQPSRELQQLHQQILADDPTPPAPFRSPPPGKLAKPGQTHNEVLLAKLRAWFGRY